MKRYSKLQSCPLVILNSISANSPSKQQGGRHIVIGAMGSVDRVITLGGGGGGGGRKPETGIIYGYVSNIREPKKLYTIVSCLVVSFPSDVSSG